ncbi:TPA: BC1881 family protein [Candidatus Nomurabacteria bacterium]|nr:BC1881 family protein [Candidatus Nomurabacteria bacterium]
MNNIITIDYEKNYKELKDFANQFSNCKRRKVAACLISPKTGRILITMSNRHPDGDHECIRDKNNIPSGDWTPNKCCGVEHSEKRIFDEAKDLGLKTEGLFIQTTYALCHNCAELVIKNGIKKVVYTETYEGYEKVAERLKESGIEYIQVPFMLERKIPFFPKMKMLELKDVTTQELLKELKAREGVKTFNVNLEGEYEIFIDGMTAIPEEDTYETSSGPATILLITD